MKPMNGLNLTMDSKILMNDQKRNFLLEEDENYNTDDDCVYWNTEDVESNIYW